MTLVRGRRWPESADLARLGLASSRKVTRTQNMQFWKCSGLAGVCDRGQGADEVPESLDWAGFAGDVDAGVRLGEDEGGQGLGGRGDRDVGRCGRGFRGE